MPNFLHGRPPAVAKHIVERLTRAPDYRSEVVEVGSEGGTFRIRSVTQGGGFHEVNFSDPGCTCFGFNKSKLPCKHLAALFLLVIGWGFSLWNTGKGLT